MRYISILLLWFTLGWAQSPSTVPSPEAHFGFPVGSDQRLLDWEQIVHYLQKVAQASPRVQYVELGKTTQGRPMVMMIISHESNMARLDSIRWYQQQIAEPFQLDSLTAQRYIQRGKLVFLITLNIHSTEIAASQEAVELVYEMATRTDSSLVHALKEVVLLLVPSLNPDGQDLVVDWYRKTVGTPAEGTRPPFKYHYYADHDNNRDWFFFNLKESQLVARVLYHEWYPEVVFDQHQMGSTGARFFLPPYSDPVSPVVPPSLMAHTNAIGKYVIARMHDAGFTGLVTNTIFNAYFMGTMSKTPLWQNRIGILSEAASARLASPIYLPRSSLRGMGQELPEYKQQTNFLDPWPGGWWRLRDIIDYEKAATYEMLFYLAANKTLLKRNFYQLNRQAIEAGQKKAPRYFVIPRQQWDPAAAITMLQRLRYGNVKIYVAEKDFTAEQRIFRKGDFIIPTAQPNRAYIIDLLSPHHYPDLRQYPGGPPRRPYDVTTWTLPLQMQVETIAIKHPLTVPIKPVEPDFLTPVPSIQAEWLSFPARNLNSFRILNYLLHRKIAVWQQGTGSSTQFVVNVPRNKRQELQELFSLYGVMPQPFAQSRATQLRKLSPLKLGIYQPYIPWVYDEGWLRLILDEFQFPYQVIRDEALREGKGAFQKVDVIVFGSQNPKSIVRGIDALQSTPTPEGEPQLPAQYRKGIGKSGIANLKRFIKEGGTAIFIGEACNFAIESLNLPARNALKAVSNNDFFAPGTLVRAVLDTTSDLTAGMPPVANLYINNPLALKLRPYHSRIVETAIYPDYDVRVSGWLIGESRLPGTVALAEIPYGKGKVILYAFRVHHRAQTYGTFKLLFNAFYQRLK